MFIYGKTAANAIAVMSYLAADPLRRAGSAEIASARDISQALTAKLLTQLAAAGLVAGQPGPGGGYTLARPARDICLMDIVELFEQTNSPSLCPFGPNWCGKGDPCPLHDTLKAMVEEHRGFMEGTRLSIFARSSGAAHRAPRSGKSRRFSRKPAKDLAAWGGSISAGES